ncbi:MAG: phage holin [Butyrivibrio sp.]|uniref:phage holin n=1 Tax=Butyrivibrio sp. TaxID=28121 RepID=UPI001B7366EC|nr:phage holin [Butyrivibrio sp.]MBP3781765.1 phage holin [Butyrivibrio sp.]
MNEIMFTILEAVVSLAIILVMRYLIPYLKIKLKSLIDETLWDAIVKAVKAAEQTIKGSKQGVVKKEDVLVNVTAWAVKHGINITQEQLSRLIESAVWIMNNEDKKKS